MNAVTFSPESQCGRKTAYPSKAAAKRIARISETRFGGGRILAYRCGWCDSWHCGHRPHRDAIATRLQVGEAGRTHRTASRDCGSLCIVMQLDACVTSAIHQAAQNYLDPWGT